MTADSIKNVWDRVVHLPSSYYLQKIKDGENFSLSRFGDGETLCMFHADDTGVNCDGSLFLKSLSEPLKDALRHQYPYYRCLLDCSFGVSGEIFAEFLNKECPTTKLYYGEIWQELSFSGRIGEIVEALATRKMLFVGNKKLISLNYLKGFENIITGNMVFMPVPEVNAFTETESVLFHIKKHIEAGYNCVCFSAGYATKVWIDMLYPEIGDKCCMIDFGSLWSPYCGDLNRSGMVSLGKEYFQQFTNYQL